VACDAIAPGEAEAELFGRAAGEDREGNPHRALRARRRGTLYLGEVAALPPAAQAALLRALHTAASSRWAAASRSAPTCV